MNFNELYPKNKEYYYLLMDIKTTAECNVSNCVIDKQKAKLLMRYINKKEKEIKRLNKENKELKSDLEYVMEQAYGAFTQNWCIDWNFTNIREKYNISNELEGDKE